MIGKGKKWKKEILSFIGYPFNSQLGKSNASRLGQRIDMGGRERWLWIEKRQKISKDTRYPFHILHLITALLTRQLRRQQKDTENYYVSFNKGLSQYSK